MYRAARCLWPLARDADSAGRVVNVLIDELKSCLVSELLDTYANGHCWVLEKRSSADAVVRRAELHELPAILAPQGGAAPTAELLRLYKGDDFPPSSEIEVVRPSSA